ncbi:hypothetical protein, partial [Mesorhizobium sp. P5_C1]
YHATTAMTASQPSALFLARDNLSSLAPDAVVITIEPVGISARDLHPRGYDRIVSLAACAVQVGASGRGHTSIPVESCDGACTVAFNVGVIAIRIERIDRLQKHVCVV